MYAHFRLWPSELYFSAKSKEQDFCLREWELRTWVLFSAPLLASLDPWADPVFSLSKILIPEKRANR